MGRLLTMGFEWNDARVEYGDAALSQYFATMVTSPVRTGTYSAQVAAAAGGQRSIRVDAPGGAGTSDVWYYLRFYLYIDDNTPTNEVNFWQINDGIGNKLLAMFLTTSGTFRVEYSPSSTVLGSSSQLPQNTWVRVEIGWNVSATANNDQVELRFDGTTEVSGTGLEFGGGAQLLIKIGTDSGAPASCNAYVDDIALNHNAGLGQTSWPDEGKVVLARPISDVQRGSWTGGAGGTTNLFDAINNTPPVGTASETNTTQIESIDDSGDNATDEARFNCTTYTDLGIDSDDVITVIQPMIAHGEDASAGTKTGSFGMQTNPAESYQAFTYGGDAGALGTWPASWDVQQGVPTYNPSVTKGSSPVVAVRTTNSASARVRSVCALGVNVEYQVVEAAPDMPPKPNIQQFAVRRSYNY